MTPGSSRPTGVHGSPPAGSTIDEHGRRVWRIEFPPGQELLNANDRNHWAKQNRITRQLRSDAFVLARYLKIPRLECGQVDAFYEPPSARTRTRDAGNWYPTYKAQIDGLVDAGVFAGDDHTQVSGPFMYIGEKHPRGRVVLVVTELPTPSS